MTFQKDPHSALSAITEAQKIAFAPVLFQAAWSLRERGILAALDKADEHGLSVATIAAQTKTSEYGVKVLLDMGLSGHIVWKKDANYALGKVGYFLLHDAMTRTNMDFTQHVCYTAMAALDQSIETGKPEGLKVFGEWPTIYPALSSLPEPARSSWFNFDHFYSDRAFDEALNIVFANPPTHLYDIGGNTGKWALRCATHNADVHITLLDLPEQLSIAKTNIQEANLAHRVHTHAINMLDNGNLPNDADAYWMSQFLDCFSEEEIVFILTRIKKTMKPDAKIYIMELFWDRQRFEAGTYSLNATSLYFTCLANGNSRFYHSSDFIACIEKAGLRICDSVDDVGHGHTLFTCENIA